MRVFPEDVHIDHTNNITNIHFIEHQNAPILLHDSQDNPLSQSSTHSLASLKESSIIGAISQNKVPYTNFQSRAEGSREYELKK